MSTLKFLIYSHWKRSQPEQKIGGFTLIELLVAMLLAALIITPLLGFLVDIMGADRREQAQAASQQEIQAALDYINRDLQQAIYVYDNTALNVGTPAAGTIPAIPPIKNQLPTVANGTPVLVFWKREFKPQAIAVAGSRDDTFVYSLVAYYLITNPQGAGANPTWSNAARIARFQVQDGVQATSGTSSCPGYTSTKYVTCPQDGFKGFIDAPGSTTIEKIQRWQKASAAYTNTPQVLVDFIDQSAFTPLTNTELASFCPGYDTANPPATNPVIVGSAGFYTCVDSRNGKTETSVVQVFLRGNARARLGEKDINYNQAYATQFPTASIRVEGRSFLFTQ